MARFHIDEDVRVSYLDLLNALGHDTTHARRTLGQAGASDSQQLLFPVRSNRVLLTHNGDDFLLLHDAWRRWTAEWQLPESHPGILLIPQQISPDLVVEAVDSLVSSMTLLPDECFEWRPHAGWRHHLFRP